MTSPYLDLVSRVLRDGNQRGDRTGTGTISLFGTHTRYDLRDGFPLLTTKRVPFNAVIRELLWFLRGSTNIHDDLTQHTQIWDAWADERGELGPIYGHQWRSWGAGTPGVGGGIDQISEVIGQVRTNPDSRRLVVSAWNVADVPRMKLPPCHLMFQLYVDDGDLDLQMYQRSADLALGVPFNIASYSLLLTMIANECGLRPRYFNHCIGDAHVYLNHVDGIKEQLARSPRAMPSIRLPHGRPVLGVVFGDVELHGYDPHPPIRFKVAV